MSDTNVYFMNKQGLQAFNGKEVKPVYQPLPQPVRQHQPYKTVEQRKEEFEAWTKLRPVYFQTWMWEVACQRSPDKYKMYLPTYQGQRVVLT